MLFGRRTGSPANGGRLTQSRRRSAQAPGVAEETGGFRGPLSETPQCGCEAAEQDKGRRPRAFGAGPGGAKQRRNFTVEVVFYRVSQIKTRRPDIICAAGSGIFIPPPAPRRLVEP